MSEDIRDCSFNFQSGNIDYIEPNLSLAYSELAPLVTEAYAFLRSGQDTLGTESLKKARKVIDQVSMRMAVFKSHTKP